MTGKKPPPHGNSIRDCEDEIRGACSYLEEIGLRYKLIDDYIIEYFSEDLVVVIAFEKYYGTLAIDYYLPRSNGDLPNLERAQRYSLIWTLGLYKNGEYMEKYLSKPLPGIQQIEACVRFF